MRFGRSCSGIVATLVLSAAVSSAQPLPRIALDSYPPAAREPIARALAEATAHPEDAASVGALAMLLHAWDEWATASAAYARARALERRFDWCYLGGLVESRLAHHATATSLLTEAVAIDPTSLPARLGLADALFESGSLEESRQLYGALTGEASAEPHARYGLGRVLAARGDYGAAVAEFDAAVRLYPEFGAAWYGRGLALRYLKRLDEARQSLALAAKYGTLWPAVDDPLLARVRALREDAGAHMSRGLALERQGDLAGAVRELEAAAAVNPQLAQAHVNLITLYGRQHEWAKAEAHYAAVLRIGSNLADAHYNYGVALIAQGKTSEAAGAFQTVLELNPQHAGAWNNLGQTAESSGRLQDAENCYRRAAENAPADAVIRFNLARMLLAGRRYPEAIAQFERLLTRDHPDRARFLFGLATAHVQAGDLAAGRQIAIEARDLARVRGQVELAAAIDRDLARLP